MQVKQGAISKSMALLLMKLKQFLMMFGIPLMNNAS